MRQLKGCLVFLLGYSLIACDGSNSDNSSLLVLNSPIQVVTKAFSTESVRLRWIDKSQNEDGFIIEKSSDNVSFEEVARVAANQEEYFDLNSIHDQAVFYRIASYKGSDSSAYSEVSSVLHYFYDACLATPVEAGSTHGDIVPFVISGLNYSSANNYSVTSETSGFGYDDSLINFSIGYISLSQVNARSKISLLDFVAGSQSSNAEIENKKLNIMRLLMSLDSDEFNDNGIQLACEMSVATGEIDFSMDEQAFSEQADLIALLNGRALQSHADARIFLYSALHNYFAGDYTLQYTNHINGLFGPSLTTGNVNFTLLPDGTIENVICTGCPSYTVRDIFYNLESANNIVFKFNINQTIGFLNYYRIRIVANIEADYSIAGFSKFYAILGGNIGSVEGARN